MNMHLCSVHSPISELWKRNMARGLEILIFLSHYRSLKNRNEPDDSSSNWTILLVSSVEEKYVCL